MCLYFLVIIDVYSKFIEVVTVHNPSIKATIDALSSRFARYGLCEVIVFSNFSHEKINSHTRTRIMSFE